MYSSEFSHNTQYNYFPQASLYVLCNNCAAHQVTITTNTVTPKKLHNGSWYGLPTVRPQVHWAGRSIYHNHPLTPQLPQGQCGQMEGYDKVIQALPVHPQHLHTTRAQWTNFARTLVPCSTAHAQATNPKIHFARADVSLVSLACV